MSSGWSESPRTLADVARQKLVNVHTIAFDEVHKSFKEGSTITGAKGQPVDEFELRPSIIQERHDEFHASSTTNKAYAPNIEEGVGPHGPLTPRSVVGQFHNREATVQGWDAIVKYANETATS